MKLWKRTVLLMLVTLLYALIPVGTLSLYITGKRSLNNAAETYGRQLENGKVLLEQFWDNSKYEQMSETGKRAYMGFQFQRCCGEGIWVKSYEKAGKKIFEVSDTGMGIPEEELGKITDAFYMVDKSRSRKEGGSGLGLALCVKVAEIHGGCLKIESRQRERTTVRAIF